MVNRDAWNSQVADYKPTIYRHGLEPIGEEATPTLMESVYDAIIRSTPNYPVWVVPEPHGDGWEVCREIEGGCWPMTTVGLVIGLSSERERFSGIGGRVFLSPEAFQSFDQERQS